MPVFLALRDPCCKNWHITGLIGSPSSSFLLHSSKKKLLNIIHHHHHIQEVNLKGTNVKIGGAVHNAVQAWCKHWLWTATRRKSVFLMSEALSLAATFKIPFDCISEIMQKTNKPLLKFEPWVRFSELSNVSLRSLIPDKTIKECYDTASITRVTFYGRSLFLVSPKIEEYINEKEANEMWCNNSGDVFAKIMTAPSLR